MSTPRFPLLDTGMVIGHDPDRYGVYVLLRSGQSPASPVLVGIDGPADALRVSEDELPTRGTWGLIAFPHNDPRNGIWLKSLYSQNQDAITNAAGDPFLHYKAEWSGYWEHRDSAGNESRVFPDGTAITCSASGAVPTTYRHIVDGTNTRQRVPFTQAERVANPPAPFIVNMAHASGTQVQVDGAGNVNVTGNAQAVLTLTFGGTTLVINASGDVTVTAGSTTFTITKSGAISLDAGSNPVDLTASTVAMAVQAAISIAASGGATSDSLALVSKLISWLSNHTHTGVNGTTSTPNQSLSTGDIAATTLNVSG